MKNLLKDIIEDKEITNWHILVLFITMEIVLLFIMNNYVLTRETFGNIYAEDLDINTIDNLYIFTKKFSIWGYLFSPILMILRVTFVSLLVQLIFMLGLKEVSFKNIFRTVLIGYGFLVLSTAAHLVILLLAPAEELSIASISIMPFSLSYLFTSENMNEIYLGILNNVNIFEIFWIFIVSAGVSIITGLKYFRASIVTLSVWLIIFLFKTGVNLYLYNVFDG